MNPSCVRRRCKSHIAWRTCDAVIRAAGLSYKSLRTYFNDGITWTRLRQMATLPQANGGLALFKDGGAKCKQICGANPHTIIDGRPIADLEFLKFASRTQRYCIGFPPRTWHNVPRA